MVNSIPPNTHFNPFTEASSEFSSSGSSTSDLSKLESSLLSGNMNNARRLLGSFSQKLQHLAAAGSSGGKSSGVSSALSKLIDGVNSNKPDVAMQAFAELKSALKTTLEDHVGHNTQHDKDQAAGNASHAPARNNASGKIRGGLLDVKV